MRGKRLGFRLILTLIATTAARIGAQDASRCTPPATSNWRAIELAPSDSAHLPPDVYLASQVDVPVRRDTGHCVSVVIPSGFDKIFRDYAILEFIVNADGSIEPSSFKVLRATNRGFASYYAKGPIGMGTFLPAELHGRKVRQLVQQATFTSKTWPDGTRRDSVVAKGDSVRMQTYFEFQVEKPASSIGNEHPMYPAVLRAAKVEGSVVAQFVVLEDGSADMDTFKILRSSHELFSASAREFVSRTRFTPAEIAGKKVRQLVQLPFQFRKSATTSDTSVMKLPSGVLVRRITTPDSIRERGAQTFALPVSTSTQVYTEAQVDMPVRNPDGRSLSKTLPAEVVAMFGGQRLLEFVVNADGKVAAETPRVVSASSPLVASMPIGDLSTMYFIPAELHGERVRQLVQLAMPVSIRPAR